MSSSFNAGNGWVVCCPHCGDFISIIELNCKIFRHGVFKSNGEQIPPHSAKEQCDYFINNDLIYGCGKPFRDELDAEKNELVSFICDYI